MTIGDPRSGEVGIATTHQFNLLDQFLGSKDGQALISRYTRQYGLPESFGDDIRERVLNNTRRSLQNGKTLDNLEAWATTCIRNRCLDLVRSPRVARPQFDQEDHRSIETGPDGPTDDPDIAQALLELDRGRLHHAVLRSAGEPWLAAYAFTLLAVTLGNAVPSRRCPVPASGASSSERLRWISLWYAGRHHCFEGGRPPGTAVRARRSREGTQANQFLRHLLREIGWVEHG